MNYSLRILSGLLALQTVAFAGPDSASSLQGKAEPIADLVPLEQLRSAPSVSIGNRLLSLKVYVPESRQGFYRGSRFDWSGIIGSLTFRGHDFFVPWFQGISATVRDYTYQNGSVINSANNATGPAEEFDGDGGALGYTETPTNGLFLKIGVGLLRRLDDSRYDKFTPYPIVNGGRREMISDPRRVQFSQEIQSDALHYGYRYTKILRVDAKRPIMWIEHILKNTGTRPINTMVSNHNFFNFDGTGSTAGMTLEAPFVLRPERSLDGNLAQIQANRIVFRASPADGQIVSTTLSGYGPTRSDNTFCITDRDRKIGARITGNRPLEHLLFWSIRPVISIEPFIKLTVDPGQSFTWIYRYEFQSGDDRIGCLAR